MTFNVIQKLSLAYYFKCLLISLIFVAVCGCTHLDGPRFRAGKGDASKFIMEQAVLRGAKPTTTQGLPSLVGSWRYATDDSGVIIRLARNDFPAIEALLLEAFGQPQFGPIDTANGGRVGAYRITRKGGAIHFGHDADWSEVVLLRERTEKEAAANFLRGLE